jgi:hypothetical protein
MNFDQAKTAWRANKTHRGDGHFTYTKGIDVWTPKGQAATLVSTKRGGWKQLILKKDKRVVHVRSFRTTDVHAPPIEWRAPTENERVAFRAYLPSFSTARDYMYFIEDHYSRTEDPYRRRFFTPTLLSALMSEWEEFTRRNPYKAMNPTSANT